MKIRNTTAKLLTIPAGEKRPAIDFPPGISEHDEKTLESLAGNRTLARWAESGKLVPAEAWGGSSAPVAPPSSSTGEPPAPTAPPAPVAPLSTPPAPTGETVDLSTFTADEAKELIDAETDPAILSSWLEAEKRKGVKALLEVRLAGLGKA